MITQRGSEIIRDWPAEDTPDPDQRVLSDEDLEQAQQEGEQRGQGR